MLLVSQDTVPNPQRGGFSQAKETRVLYCQTQGFLLAVPCLLPPADSSRKPDESWSSVLCTVSTTVPPSELTCGLAVSQYSAGQNEASGVLSQGQV